MKVKLERAPKTAGVKTALPVIDFTDTFSTTNHTDGIDTISNLVFGTMPKWVQVLMRIRNSIMGLFGFKTEMPEDIPTRFKEGDYIGFFKIFSIKAKEVILGADDKHLNFRVSIYNSGEKVFNIKVTTLVQFNNTFGKVYMSVIKPFHMMVVRSMVKQAYK